jgi:type IV secretion system protein VirB10
LHNVGSPKTTTAITIAVNLWKEQQMRHVKIPLLVLLALTIASWSIAPGATLEAIAQSTALERGYRTGYSDGYSAGSRDIADHAARDYQSKDEYQRGDRNFNEAWGTAEDYRDGYQQGFESGYSAGYDRRDFDSSIPTGLRARGTANSAPVNNAPVNNAPVNNAPANSTPVDSDQNTAPNNSGQSGNIPSSVPLSIPRDAILLVELQSGLSSDASQRGDRFQARVVDPREFEGAIIEGRVTQVKRAGKVKGTAELQLSFESIRMPDGRTAGFKGDVVEVVDMGNRDAGTADSEGGVKGRSSTKDDVSKVGASTGIGAIIGLIVGGGKGAAIGAAIGGAVGAGSVLTKRGEDVRLPQGQQLKIRTSTETRIQ